MKPFIALLATLLLFTGCLKKDVFIIHGKLIKCDISHQSPSLMFFQPYGAGFNKTYYPSGLVKTVSTAIYDFNEYFDSLFYSFTYAGNTAYVKATKSSHLFFDPTQHHPDHPTIQYQFTVKFDLKTGNATQAGTTTFKYSNGRFAGYNNGSHDFTSVFDDKGNILRTSGPFGDPLPGVVYEYDYTKTAKGQLYLTSGYQTNEMYNLMEIMNWIPVQPKNLRIKHTATIGGVDEGEESSIARLEFINHKINADGFLTSFDESNLTIVNTLNCQPLHNITK